MLISFNNFNRPLGLARNKKYRFIDLKKAKTKKKKKELDQI